MNIKDAHNRKLERYGSLVADLRSAGYKVELSCVEFGSRGLITNDNKTRINTILKFAGSKACQSFFRDVAKNVFLCSYALWNCRHKPLWVECPYIMRVHQNLGDGLARSSPFACFVSFPCSASLLQFHFAGCFGFLSFLYFVWCRFFSLFVCLFFVCLYPAWVGLCPTRVLGFYVPALFSFG